MKLDCRWYPLYRFVGCSVYLFKCFTSWESLRSELCTSIPRVPEEHLIVALRAPMAKPPGRILKNRQINSGGYKQNHEWETGITFNLRKSRH